MVHEPHEERSCENTEQSIPWMLFLCLTNSENTPVQAGRIIRRVQVHDLLWCLSSEAPEGWGISDRLPGLVEAELVCVSVACQEETQRTPFQTIPHACT